MTEPPAENPDVQHDEHEHESTAVADQMPFPEAEWEKLQAQDRAAAKAIVVLLTGLFVVGLFLYLIIAIIVGT